MFEYDTETGRLGGGVEGEEYGRQEVREYGKELWRIWKRLKNVKEGGWRI